MPVVLKGRRYDINSDKTFVHTGTADYLKLIGATPLRDTEQDVPASEVDGDGKFVGKPAA